MQFGSFAKANLSLSHARALDVQDSLRGFRDRFVLPAGVVYLDGNSLGALPRDAIGRVARVVEQEWGRDLIRSWNLHDWINSPVTLGAKISRLIGAAADEVLVTDTTSVNLFRLVLTALEMQAGRVEVLSESGNFPTDLYVCEGATRIFGRDASLRLVSRDQILDAVTESTAIVLLSHVHYRTSEMYDMAELTRQIHERGALVLWDLSHSAGAVGVDLDGVQADFAVGCGYKFLNGGPGAPAFLYVARRHHDRALNAISGWHGHSRPFDFEDQYVPAPGIRRFLAGTPSIIASSALEIGVDLLLEARIERIALKGQQLCDYFITLVETFCAGHGLSLASPRSPHQRGSHVSFTHAHGYEIMQALISDSVIGDFRAPNVMRFGFTPLYTRFEDAWAGAHKLHEVLNDERWLEPRYAVRTAVT
jgi:kynureninase